MSAISQQKIVTVGDDISAPPTVRKVAGKDVHLYYFQSPKNGKRFVICGQLSFCLAILLEADLNVTGYEPRLSRGSSDILASLRGGGQIEYETRYVPDGVRAPTISSLTDGIEAGTTQAPLRTITDRFIRSRQVQIENWIFLCSAINRARRHSCADEADVMSTMLVRFGSVSIDTLLAQEGIDKACMLAAIGRALQFGAVVCDTENSPLTRLSTVSTPGRTS
jgi:hypothetical protein